MQYRILGNTGISVSEIGFGCAPLGIRNYMESWEPAHDTEQSDGIAALHRSVEIGINYWDTAPGYGDGISEEIVGKALRDHRGEVYIATKVGEPWTYDAVMTSCEDSLRRLGVETIDVLQFHGGHYTDAMTDALLGPGMDAMRQLREQGKIHYIGATGEGPTGPFERAVTSGDLDTMQIGYNFCYQSPANYVNNDAGIMFRAEEQGMGIITMRTLTSGLLHRVMQAAFPEQAREMDFNAFCLNWNLSNKLVDVALVGMRRPSEVDQNAAISDAVETRLDIEGLHRRFVD
jgi:uncharacterized protein